MSKDSNSNSRGNCLSNKLSKAMYSLDAFLLFVLFAIELFSRFVGCFEALLALCAPCINEIYCTFACVYSLDLFMVKPY